jgi:hypothetical protein
MQYCFGATTACVDLLGLGERLVGETWQVLLAEMHASPQGIPFLQFAAEMDKSPSKTRSTAVPNDRRWIMFLSSLFVGSFSSNL